MALGELGGVGKVEERRGRATDAIVMFWRPIPNWQPSPGAFAAAVDVIATTTGLLGQAQLIGLLRNDIDLEEVAQVLAALIAGVISQQLSTEPGTDAVTGRVSRDADSIATMVVRHCGADPTARSIP